MVVYFKCVEIMIVFIVYIVHHLVDRCVVVELVVIVVNLQCLIPRLQLRLNHFYSSVALRIIISGAVLSELGCCLNVALVLFEVQHLRG